MANPQQQPTQPQGAPQQPSPVATELWKASMFEAFFFPFLKGF